MSRLEHSAPEKSAQEQGKHHSPPSVQPVEPADPSEAGKQRSEQDRVLHLNTEGKQAQEHPETVAGQHATGSFTDKKDRQGKK
jgi:hypothetical protein